MIRMFNLLVKVALGWWWYEEEMVSAVSSDRIRLWTTRRRPVEH